MTLTSDKSELRAQAMAARSAAAAAPQLAARIRAANVFLATLLADHAGDALAGLPISGYMPMRAEMDPLPTMRAHPGPVGVPVIAGRGQPLVFHRWTPDTPMVEGPFRALVPRDGVAMVPHVLIVPLLAFDRRGYRLGYGGGFYDRTLEGLRRDGRVLAIGLAHAAQEVARVPTEPTDQPLDAIVTEDAVIRPEGQ